MGQPLSELKPGQKGIVTAVTAEGAALSALCDLGLFEGTAVECRTVSPLGDPTAYAFRGLVAALRRRDAEKVIVVLI